MGITASKADGPPAASAPPPMPNFANLSVAAAAAIKAEAAKEAPNYMELPAPSRYEDIQREVLMALKPDLFEGMRFEITKPLNQNFFLSHSLFMVGQVEKRRVVYGRSWQDCRPKWQPWEEQDHFPFNGLTFVHLNA